MFVFCAMFYFLTWVRDQERGNIRASLDWVNTQCKGSFAMRMTSKALTIAVAVVTSGCDKPGQQGEVGPTGPAGPPGPQGLAGQPGVSGLRIAQVPCDADSCKGECNEDEFCGSLIAA